MKNSTILLAVFLTFFGCRDPKKTSVNNTNNTNNTNTNNTNNTNNTTSVCGNGVIETGEICDATNLADQTCITINTGYTGGTLLCGDDCTAFDTTGCTFQSGETVKSPPAQVLTPGSGGYLLKGVVLAPDRVINPGEVLIINDIITCVSEDCSQTTGADTATVIQTNGVISPGLIDAHNHMSYNFLPEWIPDPPRLFGNRYEWAEDPQYELHILPYSKHRSSNDHFCPASIWGELRSLIHGTTTMQGQPSASGSCINGGVRNANRYHDLGADHMTGSIASVRDITDADAQDMVADFTGDPAITRHHVHMAEGYEGNYITEEFDSYAGLDPRENRHNGVNLLEYGTSILIHSVPLFDRQIQDCVDYEAKIVWSPSSNIALYGVTAPIKKFLDAGLTIAIGPDWTPSGEDDMLSEMRYAWAYGQTEGITELTPEKIWRMSTADGAEVLGLADHIGTLEVGMKADITVFGRMGDNPYQAVLDSDSSDVRLVFISGTGMYGDANLKDATSRDTECEQLTFCSGDKYVCVSGTFSGDYSTWNYDAFYQALYNILETPETYDVSKPPYEGGRGDELLPLDSTCNAQ
ncbi:amidohydrolase family protein [Myxococcota bacterium]|nr:amidohydrolase family protein [Myxococcota bacterium]MBU1382305.1 amidohydrolase family protein [Myxococcota bacterium]MBU1498463.1 amidohydrolase family protein [Myxococcota bacterium]